MAQGKKKICNFKNSVSRKSKHFHDIKKLETAIKKTDSSYWLLK